MPLGHEDIDAKEAARRLGEFRLVLAAEGALFSTQVVDQLQNEFGPNAAYRIIFEGETVEEHRCSLPPFRPEALAPTGAKGVPRDARGHTHAGIRL